MKYFDNPSEVKQFNDHRTGTQRIYWFENGYGASVIRHEHSYGSSEGLWELAVIKKVNNTNGFTLVYDTPITDDVIGHLTEEEVERLLIDIKHLPGKE